MDKKNYWKTKSKFSNKEIQRDYENINQDDSSDEEEEKKQNKEYKLLKILNSDQFEKFIKNIKEDCTWVELSPSFQWEHESNIQKEMQEKQIIREEALKNLLKLNENRVLVKEKKGHYGKTPQSWFFIKEKILDLTLTQTEVIKSFLLHNFGRMYIYAPNIDKVYRKQKSLFKAYFRKNKKRRYFLYQKTLFKNEVGRYEAKSKIVMENVKENQNFTIHNLQELLILGRILRRSQIRKYREISNIDYEDLTEVHINFSPYSNKGSSLVKETLIATKKGLGRPSSKMVTYQFRKSIFPSCDMVHLPSEKGDYKSAYKDIQYFLTESELSNLRKIAKDLSENKDIKEETKEKLRLIIGLMEDEDVKELLKNNLHSQKSMDQIIAELIKNACLGKDLNINNKQEKIYALTYLLFKTEVYRSPSALINNMQMLELISYGKLSFEDAFEKQLMPVSIKRAIKACRSLNYKYNNKDFSFYYYNNPYIYYGEISKEDKAKEIELITKESKLMDMWLKMKLEQSQEYSEDEIKDILENSTKLENIKIICKKINQLGINFGLPSLSPLKKVFDDPMDIDDTFINQTLFSSPQKKSNLRIL